MLLIKHEPLHLVHTAERLDAHRVRILKLQYGPGYFGMCQHSGEVWYIDRVGLSILAETDDPNIELYE